MPSMTMVPSNDHGPVENDPNWKETNNYLILEIHPLPTVIVWEEDL